MAALTFDVAPPTQRNRVTVLFRIILAIPHLIVAQIWGYAAWLATIVQWFSVLFTGERHVGIWNFQSQWLGYYARVHAYTQLLFDDPYPPFGTDPGTVPVRLELVNDGQVNRLTNALRFIWAIPAALLLLVISIGSFFVLFISWLAIVFTGKQPEGMYAFIVKALRYFLQCEAYFLLMTDTYPKFG